MFSSKKSGRKGFSMIYSLMLGTLCVLIALSIFTIEAERKKYLYDYQKAIFIDDNSQFSVTSSY